MMSVGVKKNMYSVVFQNIKGLTNTDKVIGPLIIHQIALSVLAQHLKTEEILSAIYNSIVIQTRSCLH